MSPAHSPALRPWPGCQQRAEYGPMAAGAVGGLRDAAAMVSDPGSHGPQVPVASAWVTGCIATGQPAARVAGRSAPAPELGALPALRAPDAGEDPGGLV